MFAKFLGVLALVVSTNVMADSFILDREPLNKCYGSMDLRRAYNGDLSLKFNGIDTYRCSTLRFYDWSSGRTIRSYPISGSNSSYTLSKEQLYSLSTDCRLGVDVGRERKQVYISNCRPSYSYPTYPSYDRVTYEWSNNGNCKKMINGQFSGQLVPDYLCGYRAPSRRITYEWSNKHNCKKMIDGQFSGELVPDRYCY